MSCTIVQFQMASNLVSRQRSAGAFMECCRFSLRKPVDLQRQNFFSGSALPNQENGNVRRCNVCYGLFDDPHGRTRARDVNRSRGSTRVRLVAAGRSLCCGKCEHERNRASMRPNGRTTPRVLECTTSTTSTRQDRIGVISCNFMKINIIFDCQGTETLLPYVRDLGFLLPQCGKTFPSLRRDV